MGLNRPWRIFFWGMAFVLLLTFSVLFTETSGAQNARIASGYSHSVFINSDGTLWTWGRNNYGQLGDGTTIDSHTPIQISSDTHWIAVSAGAYFNLALKDDGTLWAWGSNQNGELGDNSTTRKLLPLQISTDSNGNPFTGFISIATGAFHALAVKSDGTLWAWGNDLNGRLGDNTTTNRLQPVQISEDINKQPFDHVVYVSAGSDFSLAIKLDGTLWAWGNDQDGQLGDNKTVEVKRPKQIETDNNKDPFTNLISVAAGGYHGLAIKSGNTLWAWGNNQKGQLGDNSIVRRLRPVPVGGDTWMSAKGGFYHTVGIKSDNTLWAWGYNKYSQLGDGSTTDSLIPKQILTDKDGHPFTDLVSVASGWYHNLAMKSDDTLYAWGYNEFGQVGDGGFGRNVNVTSPSQITPSSSPTPITLLLPVDGTIFDSCGLINSLTPPTFEWQVTPGDSFKSFTIIILADGLVISKANIKGTVFSYTPSKTAWNKSLTKSWDGIANRSINWKVIGTRADRSIEKSETRSILAPTQPATIVSPSDSAILSAATPPTFDFDTNCNFKFMIEFSTLEDFSNSTKIKSFSYSVSDPIVTPTLSETLTSDQWNSVKSLVGSGTGYFRIKATDVLKRETTSLVNSFTIGP